MKWKLPKRKRQMTWNNKLPTLQTEFFFLLRSEGRSFFCKELWFLTQSSGVHEGAR